MGQGDVTRLTEELADRFCVIALGHVTREFPNKLDHVTDGPEDAGRPRDLHPVFYGSFDWHSCVHGYWLMARCLRRFPEMASAGKVRALFDAQLTPEKVHRELAYLARPMSAGFERPYGWAWLLMLQAELDRHAGHDALRWAAALRRLAEAFADRFVAFLPKLTYPIRAGTHFNTAFALALALEYAACSGDEALDRLARARALDWFGADCDCQAWEPSGDDFLSPALVEAECMRRVLAPDAFEAWLGAFLPRLSERTPATLFEPARVSDRSDGKIAHLDGLNLSRAWCWKGLAAALDDGPVRTVALEAAGRHLAAALDEVAGDYMGEHWLATFALLALEEPWGGGG
jgi:hypothetical protein